MDWSEGLPADVVCDLVPSPWRRPLGLGPSPAQWRAAVVRLVEHRTQEHERCEGLRRERGELRQALNEAQGAVARETRRRNGEINQLRQKINRLEREVAAAYEPVEVGACTKVRYLRQEDAAGHAAQVAVKYPGQVFNTYLCRVCPPYALVDQAPWHVGRTERRSNTSVWADDAVLYHQCGCEFGINDQGLDQVCVAHECAS